MTSLIQSNETFRSLFFSRIFNEFGASLFNIAFLVYAASYTNATLYISLAALTATLPNFLPALVGFMSDRTRDKKRALFLSSWVQTGLFVVMAFLIGFHSMPIFLICCLINLIADLLAYYKAGLQMPIIQKRVAAEEMQSAFGLFQGLGSAFQLIGQPLGVALLALFQNSFMSLSLINAASYFISGLVLLRSRKYLDIDYQPSEEKIDFNLKKIWQNILLIFEKDGGSQATSLIVSALLMNFIANGMLAMIEIAMQDYNPFGNNYGFAVMVFNVTFSLGLLLGSLFVKDFLKKASLRAVVTITFIFFFFFALSLTRFGMLAVLVLFIIGYTFSKLNPKLSSYMMEVISSDNLAKIAGSINTLFASCSSIGVMVFVASANLMGVQQTLVLLSVLALLTFLYLIFTNVLKLGRGREILK
ncbi:MAG: MFS transporter [Streptococcaceae bacterium]|jgi:MFS family permease|nr:MFS transporter [Streptococcaceae bacterium]